MYKWYCDMKKSRFCRTLIFSSNWIEGGFSILNFVIVFIKLNCKNCKINCEKKQVVTSPPREIDFHFARCLVWHINKLYFSSYKLQCQAIVPTKQKYRQLKWNFAGLFSSFTGIPVLIRKDLYFTIVRFRIQ